MIERLLRCRDLPDADFTRLLETDAYDQRLFHEADRIRREVYGPDVYIRGLIELTNHCKSNCFYCGIRRDNLKLPRYRLDAEEILACCVSGYALGFRTFVLQGGEDPYYTDDMICRIVSEIKSKYPDCAVTLSLGEKRTGSYQAFFDAGADRYLLRHETADDAHYRLLHPESMSLARRKKCLWSLKKIGFQVGSGFMVGSPYQKTEHLVKDIRFLQALGPAMIGIGPYLTHCDTPFHRFENGSLALTLRLIAILRILFPHALIPATTALGTIAPDGRELGLKAGANVVMPNLSPVSVRKQYAPYDNKICTDEEAAESRMRLAKRVEAAGYRIAIHRGDAKRGFQDKECLHDE